MSTTIKLSAAIVITALGACTTEPLCKPDVPCVGGGGGGGGTGRPDAASLDARPGDATFLHGRVCVTTDLRFPLQCANTGADGFTVAYGNLNATSSADGSFAFTASPTGQPTVLKASRANFITSIVPAAGSSLIPSTSSAVYNQFLLDNAAPLPADHGTVFARVLKIGAPLAGATALATPAALNITRYGGSNPIAWETNGTNNTGIVALAGVPAGTIKIAVTPSGGPAVSFADIVVQGEAITFVGLEISP
jgi:hypothetical protein